MQTHDGSHTVGACGRFRLACPHALLHDYVLLLVDLLSKLGASHRKSGRRHDGQARRVGVEKWN